MTFQFACKKEIKFNHDQTKKRNNVFYKMDTIILETTSLFK